MADGPRSLREVLVDKGQGLFSGRIDVDANGLAGVVHMSDGIVLEAKLGSATGEPALWRMLLPENPRITVEVLKPKATSGAVLGKPDALLERYDERLDVLSRYAEKVGGFDRVWTIRFDALAAVLDELPDAINPVLRVLDGTRTVRQVVAESPLDDMLALRILGKLLAHGILVLPEALPPGAVPPRVDDAVTDPGGPSFDEGLEAALTSSLADADDADLAEPIPLVNRTAPPVPLVPRRVTMRPGNVSVPPDVTLPIVMGLPSAPPIETQTDLRAWLGSEEAFFGKPRPLVPVKGSLGGLSPVWVAVILAAGVILGALLSVLR